MEDIETRIRQLEEKHKQLEYDIAWGYSNYINDSDMSKMKKEKLIIRDQIEALRSHV
jgi:hypothetical protein